MIETKIGSPLRDGQDDPAPCCFVCGAVKDVIRVATDRPGPGATEIVCRSCLGRALRSLGPGVPSLHTRACVACPDDDDRRFAVVAIWPLTSFAAPPFWPACAPHLRAALDAPTPEE